MQTDNLHIHAVQTTKCGSYVSLSALGHLPLCFPLMLFLIFTGLKSPTQHPPSPFLATTLCLSRVLKNWVSSIPLINIHTNCFPAVEEIEMSFHSQLLIRGPSTSSSGSLVFVFFNLSTSLLSQ